MKNKKPLSLLAALTLILSLVIPARASFKFGDYAQCANNANYAQYANNANYGIYAQYGISPANQIFCTVMRGDTLWKIASRYHVTLDALISANPQIQNPDSITPGQSIKIPGAHTNQPVTTPAPSQPTSIPAPVRPTVTPAPPQSVTTPGANNNNSVTDYESEVARLVNEIRVQYGLNTLALDAELSRVARYKSQDMRDKNYFDHTSPTYGTPFQMMKSFGISYRTAGENIAYGYATPQAVVDGWMNSPGHRANILNASYTKIGVGYVADGHYWTQMFIG